MSKPIIFDNKNKIVFKQNNLLLEKQLQDIIEKNMESIFGVKFLISEYAFQDNIYGDGRIDSLGLDELNRPVIIEYKLNENKSVINQTLFYMNWLKDHKADFELLVLEKFGKEIKDKIEWQPRGICVAETFTKYDNGAINQMNVDIQLIQYYVYGENHDLIAFELMNRFIDNKNSNNLSQANKKYNYEHDTYNYIYNNLNQDSKSIVDEISFKILDIAEDIYDLELKYYKAFKTIKNFASLVLNKSGKIKLYLNIDYDFNKMKEFSYVCDAKNKGHWGTGNTEIQINTIDEFNKIFHLVKESYDIN